MDPLDFKLQSLSQSQNSEVDRLILPPPLHVTDISLERVKIKEMTTHASSPLAALEEDVGMIVEQVAVLEKIMDPYSEHQAFRVEHKLSEQQVKQLSAGFKKGQTALKGVKFVHDYIAEVKDFSELMTVVKEGANFAEVAYAVYNTAYTFGPITDQKIQIETELEKLMDIDIESLPKEAKAELIERRNSLRKELVKYDLLLEEMQKMIKTKSLAIAKRMILSLPGIIKKFAKAYKALPGGVAALTTPLGMALEVAGSVTQIIDAAVKLAEERRDLKAYKKTERELKAHTYKKERLVDVDPKQLGKTKANIEEEFIDHLFEEIIFNESLNLEKSLPTLLAENGIKLSEAESAVTYPSELEDQKLLRRVQHPKWKTTQAKKLKELGLTQEQIELFLQRSYDYFKKVCDENTLGRNEKKVISENESSILTLSMLKRQWFENPAFRLNIIRQYSKFVETQQEDFATEAQEILGVSTTFQSAKKAFAKKSMSLEEATPGLTPTTTIEILREEWAHTQSFRGNVLAQDHQRGYVRDLLKKRELDRSPDEIEFSSLIKELTSKNLSMDDLKKALKARGVNLDLVKHEVFTSPNQFLKLYQDNPSLQKALLAQYSENKEIRRAHCRDAVQTLMTYKYQQEFEYSKGLFNITTSQFVFKVLGAIASLTLVILIAAAGAALAPYLVLPGLIGVGVSLFMMEVGIIYLAIKRPNLLATLVRGSALKIAFNKILITFRKWRLHRNRLKHELVTERVKYTQLSKVQISKLEKRMKSYEDKIKEYELKIEKSSEKIDQYKVQIGRALLKDYFGHLGKNFENPARIIAENFVLGGAQDQTTLRYFYDMGIDYKKMIEKLNLDVALSKERRDELLIEELEKGIFMYASYRKAKLQEFTQEYLDRKRPFYVVSPAAA
jgi:hypothetical protein